MKLAIFSSLLAVASAFNADSQEAQQLLSKSRALDEQQNSWIINYSLQFASCHVVSQYVGGEDGQANEEGQSMQQTLVQFKMCPSNKCGYGCKGGKYLAPLNEFVNSYTEWQMNDKEYKCEQIRENCDCEYANDDEACEYQCYVAKGVASECVEQEKNDDGYEFDLQEFMECREIEANDYYGNTYYVGPKCSKNGQRINLGVFTDEYCTQATDDGIFAKTYGITLPYSSSSIVGENCIKCNRNYANNYGYYQDPEITEICEETYQNAAKCEVSSSSNPYPDTSGCSYIQKLKYYEVKYQDGSGKGSAIGLAVFFGISTVILAAYAVKQHMEKKSRTIHLNDDSAIV